MPRNFAIKMYTPPDDVPPGALKQVQAEEFDADHGMLGFYDQVVRDVVTGKAISSRLVFALPVSNVVYFLEF